MSTKISLDLQVAQAHDSIALSGLNMSQLVDLFAALADRIDPDPYGGVPPTFKPLVPNSSQGPVSYAKTVPEPVNQEQIFRDPKGPKLWDRLSTSAQLPEGPYEILGRGTRGTAYAIDEARVLKITNDKSEAVGAALVRDAPDPLGNAQRIESVWFLKGAGVSAFAIVQERLNQMEDGDPWADLSDLWPAWSRTNGYAPIMPEVVETFFDDSEAAGLVDAEDPSWMAFKAWFTALANYFDSISLRYHDFWHRNLLMRGEQHVAIDFGYSISLASEAPNIDVIAKYKTARAMRIMASKIPSAIDAQTFGEDVWQRLCARIDHDPADTLRSIGEGSQGRAFPINSGRILKITQDINEAQAALRIKAKPNHTVFTCYDVFRIPADKTLSGANGCFAIVQERLEHITDLNWENFFTLVELFYNDEQYSLTQYDASSFRRFKLWLDRREEEGPSSNFTEQLLWLADFAKHMKDIGVKISTSELVYNVMQRPNGDVVATDLGYSEVAGRNEEIEEATLAHRLLHLASF